MSLFSTLQEQVEPVASMTEGLVLTLSCPDQRGVVHAVSGALMELDYNIVESHEFNARRDGTFFMRLRAEKTERRSPTPPRWGTRSSVSPPGLACRGASSPPATGLAC